MHFTLYVTRANDTVFVVFAVFSLSRVPSSHHGHRCLQSKIKVTPATECSHRFWLCQDAAGNQSVDPEQIRLDERKQRKDELKKNYEEVYAVVQGQIGFQARGTSQ